ncbi:MAG: hypothetical protein D6732_28880 [Methanobacteriota archaeon]|nr:MAG: hypothetical protein D6732_28880 [Euryarchaeota archaeon]
MPSWNEILNEIRSGMAAYGRHLSIKEGKSMGLKITELESDQTMQDLVLSVHHAAILTMQHLNAAKIIENHEGVALIINEKQE